MPTTSNPRTLLTTAEAADYLGITTGTLEQWRSAGRHNVPFIRLGSRTVRYRVSDLEKWLESRLVGAGAEE
jgi:excisionase family DNA binding protein